MTSGNKKVLSISLKIAILLLAAFFIYKKLSNNTNLLNFQKLIGNLSTSKISLTLLAVFILMLLNWFIEALKWKFLVKNLEKITTWRAIESVFCGLTLAIFTPNRIGEYGGRVFFLSPKRRILGILVMAIGSVGQMVITNVMGIIAVLWFIQKFVPLDYRVYAGLWIGGIIFCSLFLLFYFNINRFLSLLSRISFFKNFNKFFIILSRYKTEDLMKIFGFCTTRFAVFTSQYCIIINMLIPQLSVFQMAMMVCILFFIQSALPSLDLIDVGVRTLTASFFFSYITHQEVAIIAATAFVWFVNLIIPAILGAAFVFKLNFFGSDNS